MIYLQEKHSEIKDELRWKNEWGGRIIFAHGTSRSCGVAILIKKSLNLRILDIFTDKIEGRFVVLNIEYEGSKYTLCNLYGPNNDNPEFFQKVFKIIELCGNDYKVTAGDFNLVMDNDLDKRGELFHAHKNAMQFIQNYTEQENIIDIWRKTFPDQTKFTWRRQYSQSRLDFFLLSNTLVDYVQDVGIKPSYKSDHS